MCVLLSVMGESFRYTKRRRNYTKLRTVDALGMYGVVCLVLHLLHGTGVESRLKEDVVRFKEAGKWKLRVVRNGAKSADKGEQSEPREGSHRNKVVRFRHFERWSFVICSMVSWRSELVRQPTRS